MRSAFFACLIALACLAPARALDGPEEGAGLDEDILFADAAESFRRHCVRVYIHAKSHAGKTPQVGEFALDLQNERPTLVGGYWWDSSHVLIEDPVLGDDFVRDIEIGLPKSDRRFPARVAGRFVKLQAMLLEVLPDSDGETAPAQPLVFVDGEPGDGGVLSYVWNEGEWRIRLEPDAGGSEITDAGIETMEPAGHGVMVNGEGKPFGLSFGNRLLAGEAAAYWLGPDVAKTPILLNSEAESRKTRLGQSLADAVLETRFRIRVKVDDDDGADAWSLDRELNGNGAAEIRAAGLVVGNRHIFVPLPLPAEGIARIEEITIHLRDGKEIAATFVGAFRDYLAVLIEAKEDLPGEDDLPYGFALLNPLVIPGEAFDPDPDLAKRPELEYFYRWRIDYALGRRRESVDYDRWLGTFRGFRGDAVVLTCTNEEDGGLAFDTGGRLAAVALTPRILRPGNRDGEDTPRAGFRPLDFIFRQLHQSDVFDPALAPVPEDEGRRLIDFGVEYQGLDSNTARLFTAASETRGGKVGILVTYVYPGSTADKLGIREHDILLRITLDGKKEPVELTEEPGDAGDSMFDPEASSGESLQEMLAYMPPPWSPRENSLSLLLTTAGVGRAAGLDYLREGELKQIDFVTNYGEPDYRNAKRESFPVLGMTVRPVTYEVARYFRRPDSCGVIVSRVEEGGKSSVAGLHQYLLITHVNGVKVSGLDDFKTKMKRFEEGDTREVELTVDAFGKTRLVKIE